MFCVALLVNLRCSLACCRMQTTPSQHTVLTSICADGRCHADAERKSTVTSASSNYPFQCRQAAGAHQVMSAPSSADTIISDRNSMSFPSRSKQASDVNCGYRGRKPEVHAAGIFVYFRRARRSEAPLHLAAQMSSAFHSRY